MRCPDCGARNSEDAAWCTQCYADLRPPPVPQPPTADPQTPQRTASPAARPSAVSGPAEGVPPAPGVSTSSGAGSARGRTVARDVRDRDGVVEWRCVACDGWSPLDVATCVVCGTRRQGFGDEDDRPSVEGRTEVLVASLLLPGLGHLLAGRHGTGLARAILAVLWGPGGLLLVLNSTGIASLPGWLLVVSAVLLWVSTVLDARSFVAGSDEQLLTTRRLGGLVLAVTLGLVAAAAVVMLAGSG